MEKPFEELYFNWLYTKVASVDNPTPSLTYWTLMRDLHSTEFVWLVSGDDNRAEEGIELRKEFIREAYLDEELPWMHIPCSVLEMLVAFSRVAAFETGDSPRDWFWRFLTNLDLDHLTDAESNISRRVADRLEHLVWRTFRHDGLGGMFPIRSTPNDQRTVEIWYNDSERGLCGLL
jgi:hypothetical protein